ncbi:uncharacterized protein RSE6_10120 [Rhynchosporium secalis]|uniref:GST N-terminal domain-containing protein n=1 Tax=Rhynchosporium secalis TaxID=38038 RepID=A0A1E1MJP0_RHYSE|nr:uncharacterized protein RSE6_10120 [Rhynchosporium secalis]
MASQMKPLKLYGGILGPNPGKVAVLLTELRVPFETVTIPISDVKKPEYTAVNPIGRLPTLIDPNNGGIKIWESGLVMKPYMVIFTNELKDTSSRNTIWIMNSATPKVPRNNTTASNSFIVRCQDKDHTLVKHGTGNIPLPNLLTRVSYIFRVLTHYWPEKLPGVIGRYMKEIKRVHGVLEGILVGRDWLVGDKCTYADLAFVTWEEIAVTLAK